MGKNIVLCSDGTGNKGGSGSDTNVFKIYNAVKLNGNDKIQVTYYDNGVGTSKHVVARVLGAAVGLGFRENVRDLYEFLGRNYEEGDDIYVFGFSRGAATVRAFTGMIEHCGLVAKRTLSETSYKKLVDEAMDVYKKGKIEKDKDGRTLKDYKDADIFRKANAYKHPVHAPDGVLKIEFLGVWDTVAALGFPQLPWVDVVVNFFRRHKFYDYEPENCVKNVYHAMAVDDERKTFWPLVWDENQFKGGGVIEQVWFPGVHSNIGGGYPREELANVNLDWMMERLEDHKEQLSNPRGGLALKDRLISAVQEDANPYGKLYDSRGGFALYYRYHPRPIKILCENKLKNNETIKIHYSVLGRMYRRTAAYAPVQIPEEFDMVFTRGDVPDVKFRLKKKDQPIYRAIRERIEKIMNARIILYWAFLVSSLSLLLASFFLWRKQPLNWVIEQSFRDDSIESWVLGHVADVLRYVLPDFFEGAIAYGVIQNPLWFAILLFVVFVYYGLRQSFKSNMERASEEARKFVLSKI